MKTLNVVAAIIKQNNRVLATKRGYGEFMNMWEFPGGKIEPNETKEQALIREIREELDCTIRPTKFALDLEYQYPTFYLKMSCFEAEIVEGTPRLLEHNDARWLARDELDGVDWIPADVKIIDYLKETMGDNMSDLENIELRLKNAMEMEEKLNAQLEKVGDGPKADELKLQLEKVDELLKHLSKERIELAKEQ